MVLATACTAPKVAPPASTLSASNTTTTARGASGTVWSPGTRWAWFLGGGDVPDTNVGIIDVDLFETPIAEVARLEASGIHTVCYLSAGTLEQDRPDAQDYPEEILGNTWNEWNEVFIDIRRIDLLGPILESRLDLCARKGFSGVEPDNIDTYGENTGYDLTPDDAVAFATWFAQAAHTRGLMVAQKNAPELAPELVATFDFAITEDCFEDGWCESMAPYRHEGKAILDAEYTDRMDALAPTLCAEAADLGISVLLADRDLTTNLERCP